MHQLSTSFVLGYHGCDREVAEAILRGEPFRPSENIYDWLGSGIYFWEANPLRGLEFVREQQKRHANTDRAIADPYVIGAVVELGYCLDLLSSTAVQAVRHAHATFVQFMEASGKDMPRNRGGDDLLRRELDCAVINHLHQMREAANVGSGRFPPFHTVRGVFTEGERIYENSGFFAKAHIQICVRDPACIKGVFRVSDAELAASA